MAFLPKASQTPRTFYRCLSLKLINYPTGYIIPGHTKPGTSNTAALNQLLKIKKR